jgi:hypothetical protein
LKPFFFSTGQEQRERRAQQKRGGLTYIAFQHSTWLAAQQQGEETHDLKRHQKMMKMRRKNAKQKHKQSEMASVRDQDELVHNEFRKRGIQRKYLHFKHSRRESKTDAKTTDTIPIERSRHA